MPGPSSYDVAVTTIPFYGQAKTKTKKYGLYSFRTKHDHVYSTFIKSMYMKLAGHIKSSYRSNAGCGLLLKTGALQ